MLIQPKKSIKATVNVPGDKAISHKALIISAIADGVSEIEGFLINEDSITAIDCLRKLNVGVELFAKGKVKIYGRGLTGLSNPGKVLNAGNSGTTIRLMMGMLAGQMFPTILDADDRGRKKNLEITINELRKMGASITGKENALNCPLIIRNSQLKATEFNFEKSAVQAKPSILIASLYANGKTIIKEKIKSKDHLERLIEYMGGNIKRTDKSVEIIGGKGLEGKHIYIPGDITYASYFIIAGLITDDSEVIIENVGLNPIRMRYIDKLREMGADITILEKGDGMGEPFGDIIVKSSKLKGVKLSEEDVLMMVDEIGIVMVAAALAKGETVINIPKEKLTKLSGRIRNMASELAKMGVETTWSEDQITIKGKKEFNSAILDSHNDEAIAMALAVAGLKANDETNIRKSQCIDMVYPEFLEQLRKI